MGCPGHPKTLHSLHYHFRQESPHLVSDFMLSQAQLAALPRLVTSITQLLQSRTCGFVVLIQLPCALQLERPNQAASGAIVGQVAAQPQPQPLAEAKALGCRQLSYRKAASNELDPAQR